MISTAMPVLAWVESPLQLIGAAEWAAAHGRRVSDRRPADRRRCPRRPTSSSPAVRRSAACEPYLGIPWKLLSRHRHWLVGDGFSGQFRLAAAVLRPQRITFLDDGANAIAFADTLLGRREYARPGVRERGLTTTRRAVRARADPRPGARAGRSSCSPRSSSASERSRGLEDLGVRIDRHRFEWTRRTARPLCARSPRAARAARAARARSTAGSTLDVYLAWVGRRGSDRARHVPAASPRDAGAAATRSRRSRACGSSRPHLPAELVLAGARRAARGAHAAVEHDDDPAARARRAPAACSARQPSPARVAERRGVLE